MSGCSPDVRDVAFQMFADRNQPAIMPLRGLNHTGYTSDQKGRPVRRGRRSETGITTVLGSDEVFKVPGTPGIEPPVSGALVFQDLLEGPRGECDNGGMRH